ncbi:hypothetical protein A5766_21310 [Gordonia sp. 852002-51296_SCH5728562-b]|nr:hypothetical protein A5766_21310 [Gordonia sp. 852002-51296_SCH5728562-b]
MVRVELKRGNSDFIEWTGRCRGRTPQRHLLMNEGMRVASRIALYRTKRRPRRAVSDYRVERERLDVQQTKL